MIIRTSLFKQTFTLLFLIALAHYLASALYIYWSVWWFDMVLHFSSGFCVGMAAVLVFQFYLYKNISIKKSVTVGLIFAFVIGISWEIFELYFDIAFFSDGMIYIADTLSDLILDVCGGFLGSLYAHYLISKK